MSSHFLEGEAFSSRLASSLTCAQQRVVIVSAFLTESGTKWLRRHIPAAVSCEIVVRWLPQDLICGASDTESWRLARSYGWGFRAQRRLHAKVYLVDSDVAFVGSANATRKGLVLDEAGNIEIGVGIVPTPIDVLTIESLVASAEPVSPELVGKIDEAVERLALEAEPCGWLDWPPEVWPQPNTLSVPTKLCVSECLATDGSWLESSQVAGLESAIAHDLSLLGLPALQSGSLEFWRGPLLAAFQRTKEYGWLRQALQQESTRSATFGRLSALLHDALIDDPRPYRSSVKQLLRNLLGWIEALHDPCIDLLRPRYTTVVSLRA